MWWRGKGTHETPEEAAERIRSKYANFRELLDANNESLEIMAQLQDDLQFAPPRRDVLGGRVGAIFDRVAGVVAALERLTGVPQTSLSGALGSQRQAVERYCAGREELARPRLSAWLSEVNAASEADVGSKAALLGEIRNKVGLPVPEGFIITTEAYRQYCGIPLWQEIRDTTRELDLNDLESVRRASERLTERAMAGELPRAVEVAIAGRSEALLKNGGALAVRSSARGEGGAHSCAGQFLSLLDVPLDQATDAYRQVIASRFSERALFYRISTGLLDVDSPMAALFLLMIPAQASGIMYTRDPGDQKSKSLWIASTRGVGLELSAGGSSADLFLVSRSSPHEVTGGNGHGDPGIEPCHLRTLAEWGLRIEHHFQSPQDIEWVLDGEGRLWIVQSRPLAHVEDAHAKQRSRPKVAPRLEGGRTVYPGRTSGPAFLVEEIRQIGSVPAGAVVFLRKPSPEIVESFPRIAGLVAEWGTVTGHAAALLREFQIPSVFQMTGAFERLTSGEPVSLDAVQTRVYPDILWPPNRRELLVAERYRERNGDPVSSRLLTLNLLDPSAPGFRPSGCKSAHDVLRYCHEKAIGAMFEINDRELEHGAQCSHKLKTPLPLNILVLDLGGGLAPDSRAARQVPPSQILSRPFQALWKGLSHPGVAWTREIPASIGDLASVLANALTPRNDALRPLGEQSYLLVAEEYMNLNSRLAYHYSLVDACVSDTPANNYISFRFEGGGATRQRRSLRACFLETCLTRHGFHVDRRTDLVNAWFRKAPAGQTADCLDILGRLMACSSQLDMYMTSREVMNWFVEQFLAGNYAFRPLAQVNEI